MENNRQRFWIVFIFFITGLFSLENVIAQEKSKWRVRNRLQASYEFDNNIREASSDTIKSIEDSSVRFLFNSRAVRISPKTRIVFSYRGGLQTYFQNAIENKLINEFDLSTGLKMQKMVLGIRSAGRLKIYLNDITDYVSGSVEGYLQLPPLFNIKNEIAINFAGLNYQTFSVFNYSENQIKWSISKKVFSGLGGVFEFSGKQVNYNRPVNDRSEFANLAIEQKDHNYKLLFQLNYSKTFLINLNYAFQQNNSNSQGYAYNKHQVTLVFGLPVSKGVWLRSYGAYQMKNYDEDIITMFPLDIDTERDESNFIIIDISKDINSNLNALVRFAYYNNESIIRNRFYNKSLISFGFDYRF